jgi:DnaJ-class molecular chaperone
MTDDGVVIDEMDEDDTCSRCRGDGMYEDDEDGWITCWACGGTGHRLP